MADEGGGNVGFLRRAKTRAKPLLRQAVYVGNRLAGRLDARIWLIGEGRSGTTWIAGLLNKDGRLLERFEPFHPAKNARVQAYRKLVYRRPGTDDPALEDAVRQIFAATYWDRWIDQHERGWVFNGILIKDIFASLLAKWALERLPPVKPVLLIRNPFAVARSKVEKVGWDWADDIAPFLADADLMADHLAPHAEILRSVQARDIPFLNHIAVWAIVHHVLFRQFARTELQIVFYEDAVADQARVGAELDLYLGRTQAGSGDGAAWDATSTSRVSSPAQVERARKDPYGSWRQGLDEETFRAGLAILEAFGLHTLYDDGGRPDAQRIRFRDEQPSP